MEQPKDTDAMGIPPDPQPQYEQPHFGTPSDDDDHAGREAAQDSAEAAQITDWASI